MNELGKRVAVLLVLLLVAAWPGLHAAAQGKPSTPESPVLSDWRSAQDQPEPSDEPAHAYPPAPPDQPPPLGESPSDQAIPPHDSTLPGDERSEEACRAAIARALWRKANLWLGSKHKEAGKLLMEDLAREFPNTGEGKLATEWLSRNRGLDHSGLTDLIIGSALNGALLGFSIAGGYWKEFDEPEKVVSWTTLGSGLAALGVAAGVGANINVSNSQAQLFSFSGIWGFHNGIIIYDLLQPLSDGKFLHAGAAGLAIGTATSIALWKQLDVDEGVAQFAMLAGVFGFETASLFNFVVGGSKVYQENETTALLGLLLPSNGAIVAGYFAGNALRWPADDIRLIGLGGFLGNLLGVAILVTVFEKPGAEEVAGTMLGSVWGSLVLSTAIIRPWRHTGQGSSDSAPPTALLNLDPTGVTVGVPTPKLVPVSHNGRTGMGIELPLLSVDLP